MVRRLVILIYEGFYERKYAKLLFFQCVTLIRLFDNRFLGGLFLSIEGLSCSPYKLGGAK